MMSAVQTPDLTHDRALRLDVESYVIRLIGSGELSPGDRVNEVHIAQRLGISRTPVREALVRMIKDGLLVHLPRRGMFVAELSRHQVSEIAEMRIMVEGFAAERASTRITDIEARRLRSIIAEGTSAGTAGDWITLEEKNGEFHSVLVAAAHHQLLSRMWDLLSPLTWKLVPGSRPTEIGPATVESFVSRHGALLDAVLSGDPSIARTAAEHHVREAVRFTVDRRFCEESRPSVEQAPPEMHAATIINALGAR